MGRWVSAEPSVLSQAMPRESDYIVFKAGIGEKDMGDKRNQGEGRTRVAPFRSSSCSNTSILGPEVSVSMMPGMSESSDTVDQNCKIRSLRRMF